MSINFCARKTPIVHARFLTALSPSSSIDMNANTESVSSFTRNCNQKQLFRVRCGILLRRNEQDCYTIFLALSCKLKATKAERKRKMEQGWREVLKEALKCFWRKKSTFVLQKVLQKSLNIL